MLSQQHCSGRGCLPLGIEPTTASVPSTLENGSTRTILLRIADRKSDIRMGLANPIDDVAVAEIAETLAGLVKLNVRFRQTARQFRYPF